eukprot:m51a1_g14326 putative family 3 adenylate cyclase (1262) ;mRNA; r:83132-88017
MRGLARQLRLARGTRGSRLVLCNMRAHLAAALAAVVAVCVAASAVAQQQASRGHLRTLERRQSSEEAALLLGALGKQLDALSVQSQSVARWNAMYEYMAQRVPGGEAWRLLALGFAFQGAAAIFTVLPDGTTLDGVMIGANGTLVGASSSLVADVVQQLASRGVARGLFWIPETCVAHSGGSSATDAEVASYSLGRATPVLVQSHYVRLGNGTGADVGWLVFSRDARQPLQQVAETADLCDAVGSVPAPASAFRGAPLACSATKQRAEGTYLGTGLVLSDEMGAPRVRVLLRGIRADAPTIESATSFVVAVCCAALVVIACTIDVLIEAFALRLLVRLSRRIVAVSTNVNPGVRLSIAGRTELRSVTRAVNHLLGALEAKTEQTEHILRSIFPEEVLLRIKRGESNSLTYPEATVLFADVCNFTLWSSSQSPETVTQYLNGLYSRMDEAVHRERATKVKTIGDAYVVACGIASTERNCARSVALIALAFQSLCGEKMAGSEQPLAFRIGVATGPCSSAMVGLKKRFFELWGPSVTLSQQIQEAAAPGETLCCSRTRSELQASDGGGALFRFEPSDHCTADAGAAVWRLVHVARETPRTEAASERTMSSTGLLSALAADDLSLADAADEKREGPCGRAVRSLRFGVAAGMLAVLAVSVAAFVGFLFGSLGATTARLMDHRATSDLTRVSYALHAELDDLLHYTCSLAIYYETVGFLAAGGADRVYWATFMANVLTPEQSSIDGAVFFAANGSVVQSASYDHWALRPGDTSQGELAALSSLLPLARNGTGLLVDPQSGAVRLAAFCPAQEQGGAAPAAGWVAFFREVRRVLPSMAQSMSMCLGAPRAEAASAGPFGHMWRSSAVAPGSPVRGSQVASATIDPRAELGAEAYVACPSGGGALLNATAVYESAAFSDLASGVRAAAGREGEGGRVGCPLFAVRGRDIVAEQRALFAKLCGIGVGVLLFEILGSLALTELLVFVGLARLSRAIVAVTSRAAGGDVRFAGNDQLRDIAHSVNALLRTRDLQHRRETHAALPSLWRGADAYTHSLVPRLGRKLTGIIEALFPAHVFRMLQAGAMPHESHEATSILFCELCGFKDWATAERPEAVAAFLGDFIGGLDGIAEQHSVTKIKTILDVYLAASGIPEQTPRHAHAVLAMALEFQKFTSGTAFGSSSQGAELRVGVSSGPCAGGIIGKRNWIYDIWSDTVNMAARLKGAAQPGTVLCDLRTAELTRDEFVFEEPRTMQLKGKGLQKVFVLQGKL